MKKLYRSKKDQKLAGVCSGVAEYFGIDPTVVRVAWVLFSLFGGSGVLAYIVCAILMPSKPSTYYDAN